MCDKIVKIKIVLRSQIRSQGFQEQRPSCATRREQVFTYKTKYVHVTCVHAERIDPVVRAESY